MRAPSQATDTRLGTPGTHAPGTPDASPGAGGGSWLWLVDVPAEPRALVVGPHELASELAAHVDAIHHAAPSEVRDLSADRFDLVLLHVDVAHAALAAAVLRECRRVTRPGGWLVVAGASPWWFGRLLRRLHGRRDSEAVLPPRLPRLMRRAGFREVRGYHALPSLRGARHLVPATRGASRAFEAWLQPVSPWARRGRRLAAALGAHPLLYRFRLYLARA